MNIELKRMAAEVERVTKQRDEAVAKLARAQAEIRALEDKLRNSVVQS